MDIQSNGTSTGSEQPGSAVAKGSYPEYRHAVSGLSRSLTSSHIPQGRLGPSDLRGMSSRGGGRPRSHVASRVNPYPSHSNRTSPATGVSAYTAKRASREAKEPPDSYFLDCASDIREFEQQWTTLEAAPTRELHKLVVKVRPLAGEYSVNPEKRTANEATYRLLSQLGQDETVRRSVMLKLIPSLKFEFVDFDGLIDALADRRGHVSHLYSGRLGPVQQVDSADPTQEITAQELPEPDPHPSCGFPIRLFSFPGL
jgi:hypothetical protein